MQLNNKPKYRLLKEIQVGVDFLPFHHDLPQTRTTERLTATATPWGCLRQLKVKKTFEGVGGQNGTFEGAKGTFYATKKCLDGLRERSWR